MSLRGEDILRAVEAMMKDNVDMRQVAVRVARCTSTRSTATQTPNVDRGVHGEIIKNVTEEPRSSAARSTSSSPHRPRISDAHLPLREVRHLLGRLR